MNQKNSLGLNSCFMDLDDPIKLFKIWCIRKGEESKKFQSGVEVSFKHRHWFTTRQSRISLLPVIIN